MTRHEWIIVGALLFLAGWSAHVYLMAGEKPVPFAAHQIDCAHPVQRVIP